MSLAPIKALFTRNVCVCVSIKRHEWIPWYQVEVFTLCVCVRRTGWEAILCVCVCITIDSIQNFDAKVDAHANVKCKQNLITNIFAHNQHLAKFCPFIVRKGLKIKDEPKIEQIELSSEHLLLKLSSLNNSCDVV